MLLIQIQNLHFESEAGVLVEGSYWQELIYLKTNIILILVMIENYILNYLNKEIFIFENYNFYFQNLIHYLHVRETQKL